MRPLPAAAACRPGSASEPRVRKELRSLTEDEYRAFVIGLSTMLTLSTDSGRRLFGPKFIRCKIPAEEHSHVHLACPH